MSGSCKAKGRNKRYCDAYRANATGEKNTIRRLRKRVEQHPNDAKAAARLKELSVGRHVPNDGRGPVRNVSRAYL
jgi:hypothetical protein